MSLLTTINRARQAACFQILDTSALTNLLTAASNIVEQFCDRSFSLSTYLDVVNGKGADWMYTRNIPVSTISYLRITDSAGTVTSVDTSEYYLYEDTGKIVFREDANGLYTHFPKGNANITISYTAGYTAALMPQEIQTAVIQVAKNMYSGSVIPAGIKSEKLGDWNASYLLGTENILIDSMVDGILQQYKTQNL
jgi:hypothetical protein